jgi:hypothetical protein
MSGNKNSETGFRRMVKRVAMWIINFFLIFISVALMIHRNGPGVFIIGLSIVFICGVYLYTDLKILIKGADAIEREPKREKVDRERIPTDSISEEEKEHQSGRVIMQGDVAEWHFRGEKIAEVNLNAVKLLGEFTTADGPWVDDWFLLFFVSETEAVQISMYAVGVSDELRDAFERVTGYRFQETLFWSTHFRNQGLWPPAIKDIPFWEEQMAGPEHGWEAIRMLFGARKVQLQLNDAALAVLTTPRLNLS